MVERVTYADGLSALEPSDWQDELPGFGLETPIALMPLATPGAPTAVDDRAVVPARRHHKPVRIDVLANDLVADSRLDPRSIEIVEGPDHGWVRVRGRKILYRPETDFYGTDSFTYTVADRDGDRSAPATVTVELEPVVPPTAHDDSAVWAPRGRKVKPVRIDVLANDEPGTFPLDRKSVSVVDAPDHGTVEVRGRKILYTPDPGFDGIDSFSYTVAGKDGSTSAPATVTVEVHGTAPGDGGFAPPFEPPWFLERVVAVQGGTARVAPGELALGSRAAEHLVREEVPGVSWLAGLSGRDVYELGALEGSYVIVQDTGGRDRLTVELDPTTAIRALELDHRDLLLVTDDPGHPWLLVLDWRGNGRIERWTVGDETFGHDRLVDLLEEGRGAWYAEASWEEFLQRVGDMPGPYADDARAMLVATLDTAERIRALDRGRAKDSVASGDADGEADAAPISATMAEVELATLLHPEPPTVL